MIRASVCRALSLALLATGLATFSTLAASATYVGTVIMANQLEIRAGVSGRVDSSRLAPGASFARDDQLVSIEKNLYDARANNAAERLDLLRNEFAEAEKAFEREEILYDEGSLSQVEFDHAQLTLQRARAELRQAESDMVGARMDVDLAVYKAPFDGVVLERSVSPGEFVNAETSAPSVATIAESGKFAARFTLDAAARAAVELGMAGTVTIGEAAMDGVVGAIRLEEGAEGEAQWLVDVHFESDRRDVVAGLAAKVELP